MKPSEPAFNLLSCRQSEQHHRLRFAAFLAFAGFGADAEDSSLAWCSARERSLFQERLAPALLRCLGVDPASCAFRALELCKPILFGQVNQRPTFALLSDQRPRGVQRNAVQGTAVSLGREVAAGGCQCRLGLNRC